VQKALLKVSCRPSLLASVIQEVLAGKPTTEDRSHLLAIPQTPASARPPATKGALPLTPPAAPAAPIGAARSPSAPAPLPMQAPAAPAEAPNAKTRRVLLQQAAASCGALRTHLQALAQAQNDAERATRLQGLYRQVHFVTVAAGMTEAHWLAQMATVFEAMLYEAMDNLTRLTPSALRTMAGTVDFLEVLFQYSRNAEPAPALSAQVLIVDNDPLSNRLVVSALGRAKLRGRSTADSIEALQWLLETRYDLVLLDVEMPGLDAVQLCEQLRTLPGYDQMPVIFLAGQHDFASRAEMAGERQDVISKPVFPMELAVKAVTQLLKNRMRQ